MKLRTFEDVMLMRLSESQSEASRLVLKLAEDEPLGDAILDVIETLPTRSTRELRDWVDNWEHGSLEPPRRVEVLAGSSSPPRPGDYWKASQFGYAVGYDFRGGMHAQRRPSEPGEIAYMVSKTRDMRGGASWFLENEIRFTRS